MNEHKKMGYRFSYIESQLPKLQLMVAPLEDVLKKQYWYPRYSVYLIISKSWRQ